MTDANNEENGTALARYDNLRRRRCVVCRVAVPPHDVGQAPMCKSGACAAAWRRYIFATPQVERRLRREMLGRGTPTPQGRGNRYYGPVRRGRNGVWRGASVVPEDPRACPDCFAEPRNGHVLHARRCGDKMNREAAAAAERNRR